MNKFFWQAAIVMALGVALMLAGCAQPPIQQGCGLLPIPPNATPAEHQRLQWQNNDRACKCGLASCPDYALPS